MKSLFIFLTCVMIFLTVCRQEEPRTRDVKTDKQNKQIVGTGAEAESLMNNLENTSPDLNKQTENLKKSMDTGY